MYMLLLIRVGNDDLTRPGAVWRSCDGSNEFHANLVDMSITLVSKGSRDVGKGTEN